MRLLIAVVVCFSSIPFGFAQDDKYVPNHQGQLLEKVGFIIDYDTVNLLPYWVAYELNDYEIDNVIDRKYYYKKDPHVSNCPSHDKYTCSGYDRGHLKPAADSKSNNQQMEDCSLMSNIAPQTAELNQKIWKNLEEKARDLAKKYNSIYIVTGRSNEFIDSLDSGIMVPSYYWKSILIEKGNETFVESFLIPNNSCSKYDSLIHYFVSVDELELKINLDLFSQLPDSIEVHVESVQESKLQELLND
jgi:endonuclease G